MFQCRLCPKNYQLEDSLTVHTRSVHEDIKYDCSYCDHKSTQKSSLAAHIRGVHGTTKIQCEHCEFQCKWKSTLKQHEARVHFGQSERFQCDKCPSTQSSLGNLKLHNESHHLNISYDCTQCGKSFRQKCGLTIHVKAVHDGEKKSCDVCGFQTFFMAEHKKRIHAEKVSYNCETCGIETSSQEGLRRHTRKVHDVLYTLVSCVR